MPTPRLDDYDKGCLDLIAKHGWMVQGVFPTRNDPDAPFAYTVGLTAAGLPELVISGLSAETSCALLNNAARRSLGEEFKPGQVLDGIASVPFRVVDAPSAEVNMAHHLYEDRDVRALQLVWPDKGGAYPGEPGWSLPDDAQPIYA